MASSIASGNVEQMDRHQPSGGTPKILRKLRGKTTKLGNNVVLSCSANTGEETTVTWFKNGAEFQVPVVTSQEDQNNSRIHMKRHQDEIELVLNDVRKEDAGYYLCVASNSHGEASSMAELSVRAFK